MSRRDVRLRAIRAEIHKCRDELVFLGCEDKSLEDWRDEALDRIMFQFNLIAPMIPDTPLLKFVNGVKSLLQKLKKESFSDVGSITTFLNQSYSDLKPLLTALANAISNDEFSEKITAIENSIARATKVHPANADHYLQSILKMIGVHIMIIYYEFMNEPWLKPVATIIPTLSGILHDV
jgi:hypothetical protein